MRKRWMLTWGLLVAIAVSGCLAGCSQADAVKAASTIHAYLPVVMGLAREAMAIVGAFDPAEAGTMQALSAKVQAELQELEAVSGAYAAAPSRDGWTRLGAVVDVLVSDADEGLLAAVAIKNPASQAKAKVALSALDAAIHIVDGYLMAARTPDEAKAVAARRFLNAGSLNVGTLSAGTLSAGALSAGASSGRALKLQTVVRYWGPQDWQRVDHAFGGRGRELAGAEMRLGF